MKVYKFSEQELKKVKNQNTLFGVVYLVVSLLQLFMYETGQRELIVSAVLFSCVAVAIFFSSYKLDQCYIELDGKVLTEYFRGKIHKQSNLDQAQIRIIENKKKPQISVLEKDKPLEIYKAKLVSVETFNELINDVRDIVRQQEE